MAENMKEIKERIDSVKNTNQITNAMNIVSSTKFKKFQILTLKSREYSKTIETAFDNLVAGLKSHRYEIFDGKSEVKKIGIVVMTSDRGLGGSFNSNTLRKLEEMKKNFEKEKWKELYAHVGNGLLNEMRQYTLEERRMHSKYNHSKMNNKQEGRYKKGFTSSLIKAKFAFVAYSVSPEVEMFSKTCTASLILLFCTNFLAFS